MMGEYGELIGAVILFSVIGIWIVIAEIIWPSNDHCRS
jgi:hypothetical protein